MIAGVLSVVSATASALDTPNMIDETSSAGITQSYEGGWEFYVGGGVAAFDCNGDKYPELYFAGGINKAGLFINQGSRGGALSFVPSRKDDLALDRVTGAYPLDVDGDGFIDLAVLRVGENILFRGKGNCRFESANVPWNFAGGDAWSTAFSATWETDNNWPTLAIGNYVDRAAPGSPWGTCHDNSLHIPDSSDGRFSKSVPLTPGYCALSMLFSDWNRSGTQSLRISNDRQYYKGGQEQLWRFAATGKPVLYSKSEGWKELKIWGMGIASHDLNGNGRPEYYLTSMGDNKLRMHTGDPGRPTYKDMSRKFGITAHRPFVGDNTLPSTGWHAQFEDVNNDGFTDLFVAKGNLQAMPDFAMEDPNNLLIGSPINAFKEVAHIAGIASNKRARGGMLADLNLDGLLDVVSVNREENIQIWRNVGLGTAEAPIPMGNWVALSIKQTEVNKQAVGAWIEVRAGDHVQRKEITVGGGHASGHSLWHHFGLGVAERVTARVQWPDGQWGPWVRLFANQFAQITRGDSVAAVWLPSRQATVLPK
jgi:hypothetical protein